MEKVGPSILVFGRRGHGKTTLAVKLAQQTGRAPIVFDVKNDITAWPDRIVATPEDFEYALHQESKNPLVYRVGKPEEDFGPLAEILWGKRGYCLVVDEAHWLQKPQMCDENLARFIRQASPGDMTLIQTMHAPADSWGRARSLASDWYIFMTTREADLKAVQSQCEFDVEILKQLGPHEYVHWDDSKQKMERVDKPKEWFVELHDKPNSISPLSLEGEKCQPMIQ